MEALLNALRNAGWTVTASWPIDTENRQRWEGCRFCNAVELRSSGLRPRENADGSLRGDEVGDGARS
jgi:adenine-specific DNA methylase